SSSSAVIGNASTFACGPYEVPNALIQGTCVYTNNPPCGAMRGFGAVQACFAYEAQMDKLAKALAIDPVELRVMNAMSTGSIMPTGQVVKGSAPVREVIERCATIPMPSEDPDGDRRRDPISLPGGVAGNGGGGAVQLACQAVGEELARRAGQAAREEIADYLDEPISATRTYHHRPTQPLDENGQGDVHVSLAFAAERAVVEVDTDLGLVRVVQIAAAQDVGRAINPQS